MPIIGKGAPLLRDLPPTQQMEYLSLAGVQVLNRPSLAYPDDLAGFIENVLGDRLWSQQRAICNSVRDNRYTWVRKCHSSGGTWLMARLALAFLFAYPKESTTVLTTAPTGRQGAELLWRELRDAWQNSKVQLPGRLYEGDTRVQVSNRQFILGFSAGKAADVPGFHARRILVLKDEATGIEDEISKALDSSMSSGLTVRTVAMSQPTEPSGLFYDAFNRNRAMYAGGLFTIDAYETPNFTGEGDGAFPWLIDPVWADQKKQEWGEDSPTYRVRVRAQFPPLGTNQLISPEWCEAVQRRPPEQVEDGPLVLACDVAGMGRAETVIQPRAGGWLFAPTVVQHQDPMQIAGLLVRAWRKWGAKAIAVDVTGIGSGVMARLQELQLPQQGCKLVSVVAGGKAVAGGLGGYSNRGSELWAVFRDSLRNGELAGHLDDAQIADLTQAQAFPASDGRMKVDKYGGKDRSPDRGDALVYTAAAQAALWAGLGANVESGERV